VRRVLAALVAASVAVTIGVVASGAGTSSSRASSASLLDHPLDTAVLNPTIDAGGADAAIELGRAREAGATFVRINLYWESVATAKGGNLADPASS
jgi:hypothetical protein